MLDAPQESENGSLTGIFRFIALIEGWGAKYESYLSLEPREACH